MLSADGSTLLTDKKQILERWTEHFDNMLNRPAAINDKAIARLPQLATNQELDIPPSSKEVSKAIKQMPVEKLLVLMPFMLRCSSPVVQPSTIS